jgi:hypothetical protein
VYWGGPVQLLLTFTFTFLLIIINFTIDKGYSATETKL